MKVENCNQNGNFLPPVPSPHSQVRFLAEGVWEGSESLTVSSRFWFFHVLERLPQFCPLQQQPDFGR